MSTYDALRGRTVIVTRAAGQAGGLQQILEEQGAQVFGLPTIRVVPEEDLSPLRAALETLEAYSAIIFGSQNAVRVVAEEAVRLGASIRQPIACVGERTEHFLRAHPDSARVFHGPVWVPEFFRAEGVVQLLEERLGGVEGKHFLWFRARVGREVIAEELGRLGARVDAISVYRVEAADPIEQPLDSCLLSADALLFMSGETIRHFLDVVPPEAAQIILEHAAVGVIGPVALERANTLGVRVDFVAEVATSEGLVAALDRFLALRDPRKA